MAKRKVFFSYDYNKDASKVEEIRALGLVNDNKPVSKEKWNEICSMGDEAIKKWIDDSMSEKDCIVVFIGEDTAKKKWVIYEIEKAWNEKKGLLGIYIHNMEENPSKRVKGENPFEKFKMNRDGKQLRSVIKCYDPDSNDAYSCILEHLNIWVDDALSIREFY